MGPTSSDTETCGICPITIQIFFDPKMHGLVPQATTPTWLGPDARESTAWEDEIALIQSGGQGSRRWTNAQLKELLTTGRVSGFVRHHINSVRGSPGYASNPNNIKFTDPYSHFWTEHNGNYAPPT
ncbi:hypothetical protein ACNI65_08910 [Roseateles sp. So40a]|uniref:hypothetical protein n=1 Tax=Roseateles sp. So40a TaxID=3400226 RepID=UPI003A890CBF